jgi:hypothetical protein
MNVRQEAVGQVIAVGTQHLAVFLLMALHVVLIFGLVACVLAAPVFLKNPMVLPVLMIVNVLQTIA